MMNTKDDFADVKIAFPAKIKNLVVKQHIAVKEALKQMGLGSEKILFVIDDSFKLVGTLSDGDIRRWILKEGNLKNSIKEIYNKVPITVSREHDISSAKQIMIDEKIEALPVVDENRHLVDVLIWSEIFSNDLKPKKETLNA